MGGGMVHVDDQMLGAIIGLADPVGVEGVGGNDVRARIQIGAGAVADDFRTDQHQKIAVALLAETKGEPTARVGLVTQLGLVTSVESAVGEAVVVEGLSYG